MKKLLLLLLICLASDLFAQSYTKTLIGCENTTLKTTTNPITHITTINDSEKIVYDSLGCNFIFRPQKQDTSLHGHTADINATLYALQWANGNSGFPKINNSYTYDNPPTEPLDTVIIYDNTSPFYWSPFNSTPKDTIFYNDTANWTTWTFLHDLMWKWARHYGTGDWRDSTFQARSKWAISSDKNGFASYIGSGGGLHSLLLGDEDMKWCYRDTLDLGSEGGTYPCRVPHTTADSAAHRWRLGLNWVCNQIKDSMPDVQSWYYDGAAFVPGYGGNMLDYNNWDTAVAWLDYYYGGGYPSGPPANPDTCIYFDIQYYMGLDGVPDTLARIGAYFKDMNQLDWYSIQDYPFIAVDTGASHVNIFSSDSIADQRQISFLDHDWRCYAAGLAYARNTARQYHRAHHLAPTDTPLIPVTQLASHNQGYGSLAYGTTWRYPSLLEIQDQINIGLACGIRLPLYYTYDPWLGDTSANDIRLYTPNPPSSHLQYNTNDSLYTKVQWVNKNILQVFAPIMDTLEYYNGLTTRFGSSYGDSRPYGGDYSNGWHIKGHEYLDSVIAYNKYTSGVVTDSISHDTTRLASGYTTDTLHNTPVYRAHGTYVDIGFFRPQRSDKTIADTDFIDTTREYMYVLNRRVDSVSVDTVGNRYITLDLDRSTRPLWKNQPYLQVKDMVSGWDTSLYWRNDTASFTTYYTRAQGKLFSIAPSDMDTSIIDDEGVSYNNGVHSVKHDSITSRIVYIRHDSCFARRIIRDSMCAEVLIARGGRDSNTYHSASKELDGWINRNPTIARHRGSANEDMITWECIDTTSLIPVSGGPNIAAHIICTVLDDNDNELVADSATVSGSKLPFKGIDLAVTPQATNTYTFPATPVICGTDSGWVIAWADSATGIYCTAIGGQSGQYHPYTGSYLYRQLPCAECAEEHPAGDVSFHCMGHGP